MCLYYSPHFDQNIWRRGSSLTGERTKKDPAFKGFRQSSSRLKEASPIAASLYKLVPEQVKQYALYRTLTGKAIKMLKEGLEASVIKEILKKEYIDPLLGTPKKNSGSKTVEEPVTRGRARGMTGFITYPETPSPNKITRTRRSLLFQKIIAGQPAEYFSSSGLNPLPQSSIKLSESPASEPASSAETQRRIKTTSGLIYLGHLPECKKLKIWLRPIDSFDPTLE